MADNANLDMDVDKNTSDLHEVDLLMSSDDDVTVIVNKTSKLMNSDNQGGESASREKGKKGGEARVVKRVKLGKGKKTPSTTQQPTSTTPAPPSQSTPILKKRSRNPDDTPPSIDKPQTKKSVLKSPRKETDLSSKLQAVDKVLTVGKSGEDSLNSAKASNVSTQPKTAEAIPKDNDESVESTSVESAGVVTVDDGDSLPKATETEDQGSKTAEVSAPVNGQEGGQERASYADIVAECALVMAVIDRPQPNRINSLTVEKHTQLLKHLNDLIMQQIRQGIAPPDIIENRLVSGVMKLKCRDRRARSWLETNIPTIKAEALWENAKLELIEFAMLPKPQKMIGWFPGAFLSKDTNVKDAFMIIEAANPGIRTGEWTILNKDVKDGGTTLVLTMDAASVDELKARSSKLYCGIGGMASFSVPSSGPRAEKRAYNADGGEKAAKVPKKSNQDANADRARAGDPSVPTRTNKGKRKRAPKKPKAFRSIANEGSGKPKTALADGNPPSTTSTETIPFRGVTDVRLTDAANKAANPQTASTSGSNSAQGNKPENAAHMET